MSDSGSGARLPHYDEDLTHIGSATQDAKRYGRGLATG